MSTKKCFPCSKPARAGADGNSPWGGRWLRAALCRAALRRCGPAAILRCAGRAHGGLPEHSSAPRQAAVRASKPWFLQQPARSAPPAPLNPGRQCGSPRCAQRCPPCEPRGHGAGRPRSAARNFRLETSVWWPRCSVLRWNDAGCVWIKSCYSTELFALQPVGTCSDLEVWKHTLWSIYWLRNLPLIPKREILLVIPNSTKSGITNKNRLLSGTVHYVLCFHCCSWFIQKLL